MVFSKHHDRLFLTKFFQKLSKIFRKTEKKWQNWENFSKNWDLRKIWNFERFFSSLRSGKFDIFLLKSGKFRQIFAKIPTKCQFLGLFLQNWGYFLKNWEKFIKNWEKFPKTEKFFQKLRLKNAKTEIYEISRKTPHLKWRRSWFSIMHQNGCTYSLLSKLNIFRSHPPLNVTSHFLIQANGFRAIQWWKWRFKKHNGPPFSPLNCSKTVSLI